MNLLADEKRFYPGAFNPKEVNPKVTLCPLIACIANSGSFQTGNHFNNGVIPKPHRCTRTESTHAQEVRHETL